MDVINIDQTFLDLNSSLEEISQIMDPEMIKFARLIQKNKKYLPTFEDSQEVLLRQLLFNNSCSIIPGKGIEVSIPKRIEYESKVYCKDDYVEISHVLINNEKIPFEDAVENYKFNYIYGKMKSSNIKYNIKNYDPKPSIEWIPDPKNIFECKMMENFKKIFNNKKVYSLEQLIAFLFPYINNLETNLDDFLKSLELENAKELVNKKIQLNQLNLLTKTQILINIIREKFNSKNLRNINLQNVKTPDQLFKILDNSKEKKAAQLEYEYMISQFDAQINNKCTHIGFVKNFIKNPNPINYGELDKFKSKKIVNGVILCNQCDLLLICSHFFKMFKVRDENYELAKSEMHEFFSLEGFDKHTYYCKYCGASIMENIDTISETKHFSRFGQMDSYIKTFIWSESMKIYDSLNFKNIVPKIKFADSCANACIEAVLVTDMKFIKRKRNEDDPRTKLFSIIAIHVYILFLYKSGVATFKNVEYSPKVLDIFKALIHNISQQKIVQELDDRSESYISSKFMELMNEMSGVTVNNLASSKYKFLQTITKNPIFVALVNYNKILGKIPIKSTTKDDFEKTFEVVFGFKIENIDKDRIFFDSLTLIEEPKIDNIKDPIAFDDLKVFWGGDDFEFRIYEPNIGKKYRKLMNKTGGAVKVPAPKMSDKYHVGIYSIYKFITDPKNYNQKFKYVTFANPLQHNIQFNLLPDTHNRIDIQKLNITQLYDEDGFEHRWDIRIYEEGEFKGDGRAKGRFKDYKCSICKKLKSKIQNNDIKKTKLNLEKREKINSFFSFFTIRCPKSNTHEFESENCKKCKISKEILYNFKNPEYKEQTNNYFIAYSKSFQRDRESLKIDDVKIEKKPDPIINWVNNDKILAVLSNLCSVQKSNLERLGNPYNTEKEWVVDDARILLLKSYIFILLSDFNLFSSKDNVKNNQWIEDIWKSRKRNLSLDIPPLPTDFPIQFKKIIKDNDEKTQYMFLLQTLCLWYVQIYKSSVETDACMAFTKQSLKNLLKQDKLLRHPEKGIELLSEYEGLEPEFNTADSPEGQNLYNEDEIDMEDNSTL